MTRSVRAGLLALLSATACRSARPDLAAADDGGASSGTTAAADVADGTTTRASTGASSSDGDAMPDVGSSSDPWPATRTVGEWEALFLEVWDDEQAEYLPRCAAADSWGFYEASYYVDGLVQLAEATGDHTYVDAAIACVDAMIASARPSSELGDQAFGDEHLGWVSYENGSTGQEEQLYEAYMWRHVTELLRLIDGDPELRAADAEAFDRILGFTEQHIFEKWYGRGDGPTAYIYAIVTHMAAHWAWICLDLALVSDDASIVSRCETIVADIDHAGVPGVPANGGLRGQLVPDLFAPDSYFFDMWWGSMDPPGQDLSHGNAVVAYLVEAQEHGDYWQRADLERMVGTLELAWPLTGEGCAEFVDGSGSDACWFSDGWDRLGRYDPAIQARLETHDTGRGGQLYATGALNAARLGLR